MFFVYQRKLWILAIFIILLSSCENSDKNIQSAEPQAMAFDQPGAGNPIIPGWFADPTIKKFDDTYYIYATTDNEMLASGAPTVWYSNDFENWYNYTMEIPSLESVNLRNYWAPDIIHGDDGKYYLYFGNCQAGCNIYGFVSETPVGPWEKLNKDDTPVIEHGYPRDGFPSLDAQFFKDSDGKIYGYWGTWVHYNGGYAAGELNTETMKGMSNSVNIPLDQTPDPFEAPYMLKKGDKYILMYSGDSCHDETYHVGYSYSDSPYGPFTPGENNPILSTSEDKTVHGPGHHSVLKEGEDYYIVYHRHDYPMTRGGLARQISVDKMVFKNDSTIQTVTPTHNKMSELINSTVPEDIAFQKSMEASSSYHLKSLEYDYNYSPEHAVDHNNATMWKAGSNQLPQDLIVDLGKEQNIKRIATSFEFASYYYQYKLEYSSDKENWKMYADRSNNKTPGSPMIDDNDVEARYLRLTILGTEKMGLFAAVWNLKVYDELFEIPLPHLQNKASSKDPAPITQNRKLIEIDAADLPVQNDIKRVKNNGDLGGVFESKGIVAVTELDGIKTFKFDRIGALILDRPVPETLSWNGSYTVAAWVNNPKVTNEGSCLMSWCNRTKVGLANSYNALFYNSGNYGAAAHLDGHFDMRYNNVPTEGNWHFIVLTFDGVTEEIYVDGKLDNSQVMSLSSVIEDAEMIVGASDIGENFGGYMASLHFFDQGLTDKKIQKLMEDSKPSGLK